MSYDSSPVRAPRLSEWGMRLLLRALNSPATSWLAGRHLIATLGIPKLADVSFFPEMPIPPAPPGPSRQALSQPPAPPGFAFSGVADYTEAYRSGRLTPLTVAQRFLAAVGDSNPTLHAFIACNEGDVMAQARESTHRWAHNQPLGPLDGVPVSVKDEMDQRGYPTTIGTTFCGHGPAGADCLVVGRLRQAGALLAGKTNMHELGLGITGFNTHYGTVRNPYGLDNFAGGSSSGAGAAVAAGLGPVAIGADGGGSVRIPAAFCGLVGLKPTFGRVPCGDLDPSLSVSGPLTTNAQDAALVYSVMSDTRLVLSDLDLSGVRFGVYRPWFDHASPEVLEGCRALLKELGVTLIEVDIPYLHLARVAQNVIIASEIAAFLGPDYRRFRSRMGLDVRIPLAIAQQLRAVDFLAAQHVRHRARAELTRVISQVDLLLTPTTACVAPVVRSAGGESDLSQTTEVLRFTALANLTGHPAIAVPAGYTSKGLPVSLQAMGGYWSEELLLRFALACQARAPRRAPQRFYPLLG